MVLRRIYSTLSGYFKRQVRAKLDAAQTNSSNANHWAAADAFSARAAYSPAVRFILRKRSRYEAGSNSWYAGMLRTAANHIAGRGPRLQVLTADPAVNARIEKAWQQWARSINLAEKLRVIVETYWRDGEVFVLRRHRPRFGAIDLDLMLLEADQIGSPWVGAGSDPTVEDGIRVDQFCVPVEYHIYDRHPGDNAPSSPQKGDWYTAANVLHLFRPDRPGQVRGIPRATPSLPLYPVFRRHTLATLFAAESAANQAMFMKTTSAAIVPAAAPEGSDFASIEYARNMLNFLPEGWEPFQMRPEHPTTNHEMFQRQTLMEASRCCSMVYALACGTGKDSNLSSLRGDIKNVWQPEVEAEQDRLDLTIMEPVWRWFMEEAVVTPGILDGAPLISSIDHRWVWPPLPNLDELDSANSAITRMAGGLSARSQELLLLGVDAESNDVRAAADLGMDLATYRQAVAGKLFSTSGSPAVSPQQATDQPAVSGEYTELGQRAFNNNMSRIRRTLDDLVGGRMSQVMAEQTLQSIGLSPDRIAALIDDAMDGQVSDSEIERLAV